MNRRRVPIPGGAFLLLFMLLIPVPGNSQEMNGQVVDETGRVVPGARIVISGHLLVTPMSAVSDAAGRFVLSALPPGTYELKAEKPGFYATISHSLEVRTSDTSLQVVLNHRQEFDETVNVVYSAPVIDPQEAAAAKSLTSDEITDLPYPSTHDFRNALPLVPGIFKDNDGRFHLNGGAANRAYYSLDGFNITNPASGDLENRISVDAIRALRIETSRYSAEYGKGSAGVLALESSEGDDRFRFSATNFMPSFEWNDGPALTNWNPRGTVSGPIAKGRAWYYNALDLQYDLNVVKELPAGENTNRNWFGSNATRMRVNLSSKNQLAGGFLLNFRESRHLGISPLDPLETSRDRKERFYFLNIKDLAYLGGWMLETGMALNQLHTEENPLGTRTYVISPKGRSGNYFMQSEGKVRRLQILASVLPPLWSWRGRHSFKFGADANRIASHRIARRKPFEIRTNTGTLSREVDFFGSTRIGRNTSEFSAYLLDRWTLNEKAFLEAGLRFDWDQILKQPLWSPRLAFTWGPSRFPESKFSAGIGVFYDATPLELLERAEDQVRSDTFFDAGGAQAPVSQVISRFLADERRLKAPFVLNWSAGWQQKLGRGFYLQASFIRKNGRRGWMYHPFETVTPAFSSYLYRLECTRRDGYSYFDIELSRTFQGKYPWLLSFARSSAHASEILDFSPDNPLFAGQSGGPLDWDIPNRLISWSAFPIPGLEKYLMAYFVEWHSGQPWSQVNQLQELVGAPNIRRFPEYFNLNLHLERRFRFWRSEWALRAGFNNLTGHDNPTVINNNLGSLDFGRFRGSQGRVFTGRIRFLGRN